MALQTITNIDIDFYDKKYILINAKQYDKKSRFLSITCYNHGELYPINAGEHSAYVRYRKSDNNSVFNYCDIDRKGKILLELTEQMLASDGICCADLIIVNKGEANVEINTGIIESIENASILSTMPIHIDVTETAVENSDIESSYEFNGLNEALQKAEAEYQEVIRLAKSYTRGDAGGIRNNEEIDNAKYYYEQAYSKYGLAKKCAEDAAKSADEVAVDRQYASQYMNEASNFANSAKDSADSASKSAGEAVLSMQYAAQYMNEASTFANNAKNNASSASDSASSASESEDKAYNYYLQTEAITNGLNGAFLPMGTVTFDELVELFENDVLAAGYLYNISDNFITDDNFRMGSGIEYEAGTNVYYTADGQFDVLTGTTVTGVKGSKETTYRKGNVNLTASQIGAVSEADIATVDEVINYLGI